jgi:hypothetical protein
LSSGVGVLPTPRPTRPDPGCTTFKDFGYFKVAHGLKGHEHAGADVFGLIRLSDGGVQDRAIRYTEHVAVASAGLTGRRGAIPTSVLAEALNAR